MLDSIPAIVLRPLTPEDIPALSQIRPTYRSPTILAVEKSGEGITPGWKLVERQLPQPFDKGTLYDFNEEQQATIAGRLARPDETYQRVADYQGHLVGVLDCEIHVWNNSLYIWNLMVDLDYRGHGLGRRLWHRARDFAKQIEVRAILLETQNTNVAACRFYARMGCQLVGLNEQAYANNAPQDGTNDKSASRAEIALFWAYVL
jgi:ribosomal protein S18 acetylase RimI-like enzyme